MERENLWFRRKEVKEIRVHTIYSRAGVLSENPGGNFCQSVCNLCMQIYLKKKKHFENILDFSFPFLQLSPSNFRKGFCSASWQPFTRFLFIYLDVESSFALMQRMLFKCLLKMNNEVNLCLWDSLLFGQNFI